MNKPLIKALIITYYWPPLGGSGVQRWLKFTKYLRDFGVEPVIYTVKNPSYPKQDHSLLRDIPEGIKVIRQPIFEPHNIPLISSSKKNQSGVSFQNPTPSFFGKILQYIRVHYFIPDARKFWIKPSVKFLKHFLSKDPVDVVITTGPPHSLHLIGLELKKEINIQWISDFRDPWTDIYYHSSFKMKDATMRKHKKLESQVLEFSDHILTTNKHLNDLFSNRTKKPVTLITNGYDDEAVKGVPTKRNDGFSLDYIGYLPQESNPIALWQAISELCCESPDFKKEVRINLTGDINRVVYKSIQYFKLESVTQIKGYVSHDKAIQMQHSANVLLILIAKSKTSKQITSGKIFECLQSKRPMLAVGPIDGGAAEILAHTKSGSIFDYKDVSGIKKHILKLFEQYKQGKLVVNSIHTDAYHRKTLTEKLAGVIHQVISNVK